MVVLHGGPGAPGTMAPVARGLANWFRIIEPMQRLSGGERLTVARHVADLHDLIESNQGSGRPALVGSSWGAMLALAYAAAHPDSAGPLVLVGCGTFDPSARQHMRSTIEQRSSDDLKHKMECLPQNFTDPDERLNAMGNLLLPLFSCELLTTDLELESVDARGHTETWDDMMRLQDDGVYPAAFAVIESPVLMLHGAEDPHPGQMIRASLEPHLASLEYREWERCGHYPWVEKAVREEFFSVVRDWLTDRLQTAANGPAS